MLSRDKIITDEEMRRFEKLLEGEKIPDNLKINNMWDLFEHYETSSWWSDLFWYAAIAVGVVLVGLCVHAGMNPFCPRTPGKQSGSAMRGSNSGGMTTTNVNITTGGSDGAEGEEMVFLPAVCNRERANGTDLEKTRVYSLNFSGKMTPRGAQSLNVPAKVVKPYGTEPEGEEENDAVIKSVKFNVCHACSKSKCQCTCHNCGQLWDECVCSQGSVE